jgi:hypothetical protein
LRGNVSELLQLQIKLNQAFRTSSKAMDAYVQMSTFVGCADQHFILMSIRNQSADIPRPTTYGSDNTVHKCQEDPDIRQGILGGGGSHLTEDRIQLNL